MLTKAGSDFIFNTFKQLWDIPVEILVKDMLGSSPRSDYSDLFFLRLALFTPAECQQIKSIVDHCKNHNDYWNLLQGIIYLHGINTKKNYEKARDYLTKAKEQGNALALNQLGYLSDEVENNEALALTLYEQSADMGCLMSYTDAGNLTKDLVIGFSYLSVAAAGGSARAFVELGNASSDMMAKMFYEMGALKGSCPALHGLARVYYEEKNYALAFKFSSFLADKGYADAIELLGDLYFRGQVSDKKPNYTKALECFERLKLFGHARAINNIGLCYQEGWGIKQDYQKAYECYQEAAIKGCGLGLKNIIHCYDHGYWVKIDAMKTRYLTRLYKEYKHIDYGDVHFKRLLSPTVSLDEVRFNTAILLKDEGRLTRLVNDKTVFLHDFLQSYTTGYLSEPKNIWLYNLFLVMTNETNHKKNQYALLALLGAADEFNGNLTLAKQRMLKIPDDYVSSIYIAFAIGSFFYHYTEEPDLKNQFHEKALTHLIRIAPQCSEAKLLIGSILKAGISHEGIEKDYKKLVTRYNFKKQLISEFTETLVGSNKVISFTFSRAPAPSFNSDREITHYTSWLASTELTVTQKLWIVYALMKTSENKWVQQLLQPSTFLDKDNLFANIENLLGEETNLSVLNMDKCLHDINQLTSRFSYESNLVPQLTSAWQVEQSRKLRV